MQRAARAVYSAGNWVVGVGVGVLEEQLGMVGFTTKRRCGEVWGVRRWWRRPDRLEDLGRYVFVDDAKPGEQPLAHTQGGREAENILEVQAHRVIFSQSQRAKRARG